MRPGSRSLLFAVVMGAAVTPVALAEPALAAPAVCERFDDLPEQPSAQGGAQDALIAAANELARGQLLRRTRGGWQRGSLLKAVRDQARSRQIPPPRDNDVRRWLGWAG